MNFFRTLIFLLLFSLNLYAVEPVKVDTFFSKDDLHKVNNGNIISRMYVKHNTRKENSDENITIPRTIYLDEDFSIYEIISDEKLFIPYKLTKGSKIKFYNILSSFNNLEGMEYYSRRASKIKELIEKCYRVESLSGNHYNDTEYDKIEKKISNMFLQKDNKFGTLIYRSELYNEGNDFILVNTCLEEITKFIFTLNDKEEYKICSYFIYDSAKNGFYVYSFQVMRVKLDAILKTKIISPTTFSNRLRASTVHLSKLLGIDWRDKLNPWPDKYDRY